MGWWKHDDEDEVEAAELLLNAAVDADEQGLMDRANQGAGRTDRTLRDSMTVEEAQNLERKRDRGFWRRN